MTAGLRIGIDVGGTFTDVVAIDAATRTLTARIKVPTTHTAPEGVAAGIIAGIERLQTEGHVRPEDVAFIAHSTTQATNALLEGDVAAVSVLGLLDAGAWAARGRMQFGPLTLAPGAVFSPQFVFARVSREKDVQFAIDAIAGTSAQALAVTRAFGVDRPAAESHAVDYAREHGMYATSGHEVSSMYGLRARTRTAALNAAILPTMVRTARMTADAVNRAAIAAPLMVMRSDGGVMDVREVERRPILTLLSGPAAGVAGALLYENVTDGIFIEVGGTSSDCSAIRAGQPQMRPARVGGHRTMLRTLDVRTLAIAGGSMARIDSTGIVDVGPRSAHIAGCTYASFVDPKLFEGAQVACIAPTQHDPADYVVLVARDGTRIALTPTCASNFLGFVPEGAFARGNRESVNRAFTLLGDHLHADGRDLARALLDRASAKMIACVEELVADYELDVRTLALIGGGGGAAALVPVVAQKLGLAHRIARDADVISPIGVALALVRDVVERTIVAPTPEDIVRIRREAADRVVAAGAAPERVEVSVEIDVRRSRVRATASGATALVEAAAHGIAGEPARLEAAALSLHVRPEDVRRIEATPAFTLYEYLRVRPAPFWRSRVERDLRVVDERGIVRLGLRDAGVTVTDARNAETALRASIEDATNFGDVGRALPDVYVLHGGRIADFSGLAAVDQAVALVREELAGREPDARIVILTTPKRA